MSSPQVRTVEYDLSKRVPSFNGMIGLAIGNFDKGPVGERIYVSRQVDADLRLGKPGPNSDQAYYLLHSFLTKSQRCWVMRVADSSLYGGMVVGAAYNAGLGTGDQSEVAFAGTLPYNRCLPGSVVIYVDDEKVGYDNTLGAINGTILSGTVDYLTGAVSITFTDAPQTGAKIYARWGFESVDFDTLGVDASVYVDPDTYDFTAREIELELNNTDLAYADTLPPYPVNAPTGAVASELDASVVVYDGTTPIIYADENGILQDVSGGTYLETGADSPLTGVVTFTNGSTAVSAPTGTGAFTTELNTGDYIYLDADGDTFKVMVQTITDDDNLVLSTNYLGTGGAGASTLFVVDPANLLNYANGVLTFTLDAGYSVGTALTVKYSSAMADLCVVYGDSQGEWSSTHAIDIGNINVDQNSFSINVWEQITTSGISVDNLTTDQWVVSRESKLDGYNKQMFLEDRINGNSYYIRVADNPYLDETEAVPMSTLDHTALTFGPDSKVYMSGGDNGVAPNVSEYINALNTFSNKEDIDINIAIDTVGHKSYHTAIADFCDRTRGGRGDCYGVLYTPFELEESTNYIKDLINYKKYTLNLNSSFCGLYTGHLLIQDTYNGRELWIPPSGFVAAAFSYTGDQYEAWFPAAGWTRGVLPVMDVYRRFTLGERDVLYDNAINVPRFRPGKGIAIWGQKTLYGIASALDRANVRWLLIVIEKGIEEFLDNYEFEINDPYTRNLVRSGIVSYLDNIRMRRGLYDFNVVCDETNNTPEDIDNYRMNVDSYVQPVKAIEYIYNRIVITRTGADFGEVSIA